MKKNRYLMYAIAVLQGMVFYAPIATLYRRAQGVTVFQITLIESISLALCIAMEIPWGVIADKIGYRRTMIFCCGLYFFSKVIFWQATGFGWFLAERILLSIVLAGISGVDSSILYLSCEQQKSQKAFGIYNSMGMGGLLIAAAVFSLLVKENYQLAGFLTVISYGIAALLSFGLTEVKQQPAKKIQTEPFKITLQKTLQNHRLLLFLVGVALLSETCQTVAVFLSQLQYERCTLTSAAIGYLYIAATVVGMCGVWSAAMTEKIGIRWSLRLFCLAQMIACVVLAATQHALPSVMGIFLLRISNSLFQPFQSEMQNQQIQTSSRATALSIHAMLINCIAISTNLLFGFLSQINLSAAFWFGAGICLLSLLIFMIWHRKMLQIA